MGADTGIVSTEDNECPVCHATGPDGMIFTDDGSEFGKQQCKSCGQDNLHIQAGKFLGFKKS